MQEVKERFSERKKELKEKSRELLGEIETLAEIYNDLGATVEDACADITEFSQEDYDVIISRLNDRQQQVQDMFKRLEEAREEILREWERAAIETLSEHSHITIPENSLAYLKDAELFDALRKKLSEQSSQLEGAFFLTKIFSQAHKRQEAELKVHQEMLSKIQREYYELLVKAASQTRLKKEHAEPIPEKLLENLHKAVQGEAITKTEMIKENQDKLYSLTEKRKIADRVDEELKTKIQEVADYVNEPGGSARAEAVKRWQWAMAQLLRHGYNQNGETPEDLKEEYGQDTIPYGHLAEIYRRKLDNTFEKKNLQYIDPEDEQRKYAVQNMERELSRISHQDQEQLTNNMVKLFADWQAKHRYRNMVRPLDRRGADTRTLKYDLGNKAGDFNNNPKRLLELLYGMPRWEAIKNDPKFSKLTSPEEVQEFEDYLVNELIIKILKPGGRESWAGTDAAHRLGELKNIKAMPLMLDHVLYFGSGHTNREVYAILEKMAKSEAGQAYIKELPALYKYMFEQMTNPDSLLNEYPDIYNKTFYLGKGELFIAQAQLIEFFPKDEKIKIGNFEMTAHNAFMGGMLEDRDIVKIVLKNREAMEKKIMDMDDFAPWWSINGLLEALADNREFLREYVDKKFTDLSEEDKEKFKNLLEHKKMKSSHKMRGEVLRGLLSFRIMGEKGQTLMADLMDRYAGAKDDPGRLQKLFRTYDVLEKFGRFEADYDAAAHKELLVKEMEQLVGKLGTYPADKKALRKEKREADPDRVKEIDVILREKEQEFGQIEERIREIKKALPWHEQKGLAGLVDYYQHELSKAFVDRLGIDRATARNLSKDLTKHTESGLIDMATTLKMNYETKRVIKPEEALKDIVTHIVNDDFKDWKYHHELSEDQIGFLGDKEDVWMENEPSIEIEAGEGNEVLLEQQKSTALKMLEDARQHFKEIKDRVDKEGQVKIEDLIRALGQGLQDEETDAQIILDMILKLEKVCDENKLYQVDQDVKNLKRPFMISEINSVRADEFDDGLRLIKMGTEPTPTCQSWKGGAFNECLLAYVADANKKGINVVDKDTNEVLLRCVEKVTKSRLDIDSPEEIVLFFEPPYVKIDNPLIYKSLAELVFNKAEKLGAKIQIKANKWPEMARVALRIEAEKRGGQVEEGLTKEVFRARSVNEYEYSDSFDGKTTPTGQFQSKDGIMELSLAA